MSVQPRTAKILVSLIISMTAAAVLLMVLDGHSISAGTFSLASYSSLGSIKQAATSRAEHRANGWNRIEVFYSKTAGGNLKQIASVHGLTSPQDLNFHFLVCNFLGAIDGHIQATEKWGMQWPALPSGNWYGSSQTIRICVIGDGGKAKPTDFQIRRTLDLVSYLAAKFEISRAYIQYPDDWQF